MAVTVYLALFYLTFAYRWPETTRREP